VKNGKRSEVKIFGGMCVLSLIYSYALCVWVTVLYVVPFLYALCLLLFVML
jgi:hypothetical protein